MALLIRLGSRVLFLDRTPLKPPFRRPIILVCCRATGVSATYHHHRSRCCLVKCRLRISNPGSGVVVFGALLLVRGVGGLPTEGRKPLRHTSPAFSFHPSPHLQVCGAVRFLSSSLMPPSVTANTFIGRQVPKSMHFGINDGISSPRLDSSHAGARSAALSGGLLVQHLCLFTLHCRQYV